MSIEPGTYRIHTFSDYDRVIGVDPNGERRKPVVVAAPYFPPSASTWNVARGPDGLYVLSVGPDSAFDVGDKMFAEYGRLLFWRIEQYGHPYGFRIMKPDQDLGWCIPNSKPLTQVQLKEVSSGPGVGAFLFSFESVPDE
ncbi:hypothetical protein V8B97DRAFT_249411 [Scleroderma yunnanense]